MPIPTYERNPAASQTPMTGKIPIAGSPVAQSLQGVGDALGKLGSLAGQISDFKDKGFTATANAGRTEAKANLTASFSEGLTGNGPRMEIEQKAEYMAEGMQKWEDSVVDSWKGSGRALDNILNDNKEIFARDGASYKGEITAFELERSMVAQTQAADTTRKQSFDAQASGDFELAETLFNKSESAYNGMLPFMGPDGPARIQAMKQAGNSSAMSTLIATSNNIQDVEDLDGFITDNKENFSTAQYSQLKYQTQSAKNKFIAGAVKQLSKIGDAVMKGDISADEGASAADQLDGTLKGSGDFIRKVSLRDYQKDIGEDPEIVKDVRDTYEDTKIAHDAVDDYVTWSDKFKFKKSLEENVEHFNNTMNIIADSDAATVTKYQMMQDVLGEAEGVFSSDIGGSSTFDMVKTIKNKRRHKAYQSIRSIYDNYTSVTGDFEVARRFGNDAQEIYSILNNSKDIDMDIVINEHLSDLIGKTQQENWAKQFNDTVTGRGR